MNPLEEEPPPQARIGLGTTVTPVEPAAGTDTGGGSGPPEGLILLLFTLITLAVSAFVLVNEERDAVKDPKQKAARGEVKGLSELSLFREANLQKALQKIDSGKRPLVSNIRIAADRVNASVRDRDGFRKYLTIDPGLGVSESDAGVGEDDALRASQFDAAAPERMVRAVMKRTEMSADAVDYVTMAISQPGEQTWYMALKEGPARVRQWVAAADGSDVRKPGEPSAEQKAEDAKRRRQMARDQKRQRVLFDRRTACLQKARDAVAVTKCIERYAP